MYRSIDITTIHKITSNGVLMTFRREVTCWIPRSQGKFCRLTFQNGAQRDIVLIPEWLYYRGRTVNTVAAKNPNFDLDPNGPSIQWCDFNSAGRYSTVEGAIKSIQKGFHCTVELLNLDSYIAPGEFVIE